MTAFTPALPFEMDEVYHGLAKVEGLLTLEPDGVLLEFQVKDALTGGLIKSKLKSLFLPYSEVRWVEVSANVFRTVLRISSSRLSGLADLPGAKQAEAKLKLNRRDKETAFEIEAFLRHRIADPFFHSEPADPDSW